MPTFDLNDLITQQAAADIIGVARQVVWNYLSKGHLTKYKVAGKVFVSRAEAEYVKAHRPKAGRPRKYEKSINP